MNSRVLRGHVEHARLHPVEHRFRHGVHFYAIDLEELGRLDKEVAGFGYNRFAPLSLRDGDYLDPGGGAIREKLGRWMADLGLEESPARVTLVTSCRWWGWVFNPVSFYLLDDREGRPLGMIAEVNNTFGDRHVYCVRLEPGVGPSPAEGERDKVFHVSPFNDMEGRYRFTLRREGEELYIGVDLYREGVKIIETWIEGRGEPLSTGALWRVNLRHPLRAWMTFPRILCQAVLLRFWHRLPPHRRPEPLDPHSFSRERFRKSWRGPA